MPCPREPAQPSKLDTTQSRTTPALPFAEVFSHPRAIEAVDPSRCRLWPLHPRAPARVNERSCRKLIASIAAHGQFVPALGRLVRGDPALDIEILCGSRRLFAARHLGIPLQVQVRDLSNWECAIVVEVENRVRRNLSRAERDAHFKSIMNHALAQPDAGTPRLKDYDVLVRSRNDAPLFTARSYFNVLEFVFPNAVDDSTIDLIKHAIAEIVDLEQRTTNLSVPPS